MEFFCCKGSSHRQDFDHLQYAKTARGERPTPSITSMMSVST